MGDPRAIDAMLKLHWQLYYSYNEGECSTASFNSARNQRKSSEDNSLQNKKVREVKNKSSRKWSPNALIDTKEIYAIHRRKTANPNLNETDLDILSDSETLTTLPESFRKPGYKYRNIHRYKRGSRSQSGDSKRRLSSTATSTDLILERDTSVSKSNRSKSTLSFVLSKQEVPHDSGNSLNIPTIDQSQDSTSLNRMPRRLDSDDESSTEESDSEALSFRRESTVTRRSRFSTGHSSSSPIFYVSQGNNSAIIVTPLEALGWKRTLDRFFDGYRLKWTEGKHSIDYNAFREGDQLVNHIPNCELITNKLGLLLSLREYERVTWAVKNRAPRLQMKDFVPDTYIIDHKGDREAFFQAQNDGDIWIYKPTGLNQGIGITLIRDIEQFKLDLFQREEKLKQQQRCQHSRRPMEKIVQRYIHNPLLLNGHKFDIRCYMLIASTTPFMVFFRHGYVRLSIHQYSKNSSNMIVHLTNQYIQKKDPDYEKSKNNTVWSMDALNNYINDNCMEENSLEKNWVKNYLTKQIQRIMIHIFHSVKHKLMTKMGYFEVYGYDFMIDENFKVWLIEINSNPALGTTSPVLQDVIPSMISETLSLSIEIFEKKRKRQAILPLSSQETFALIYDGSRTPNNPCGSRNVNLQWEGIAPRYRNIPKPETSLTDRQQRPSLTPFVAGGQSDFCGRLPSSVSTPMSARAAHNPTKIIDKTFEHSLRRYDKIDSPLKSARKLSPIFKSNENKDKEATTLKWISNKISNLPAVTTSNPVIQQQSKKNDEESTKPNDPLDDIIPAAVTPDLAYPVPEKSADYISDQGIANISMRLAKREGVHEARRQLLKECVRENHSVYTYSAPPSGGIKSPTYLSTATAAKEIAPTGYPIISHEKSLLTQASTNASSARLLRTAPISTVRVITPYEDSVRLKFTERKSIKVRRPSPNRSS